MKITLTLPWPPSTNKVWRIRQGRPRLSDASKTFRLNVDAIVLEAGSPKFAGLVEVSMAAHPPDDHRKHDLDNLPKAVHDALEASCVFLDDEQVDEFTVRRRPREGRGRLVVTISDREVSDG